MLAAGAGWRLSVFVFEQKGIYKQRKPKSDVGTSLIRVYTVVIPSAHLCRLYSVVEQD